MSTFDVEWLEPMEGTRDSCSCDDCLSACRTKPGWFAPQEAERLARALDVSLEALFDTKLMVDWIGPVHDRVFVLSPATRGREGRFSNFQPGECVFLDTRDRCVVHDMGKPHECGAAFHSYSYLHHARSHLDVAAQWVPHQEWLKPFVLRALANESAKGELQ